MIIESPEVVEVEGQARLQARVSHGGGEDLVWFSVARRFGEGLTRDRLDAFVVGLLPLAMRLREDVEVRGPVSGRLLHHLNHSYQQIYHRGVVGFDGARLYPVEVRAEAPPPPSEPSAGVGLGFSAGVDALAALKDHWMGPQQEGYRVTHLVFNNVGSHNNGPPDVDPRGAAGRRLFRAREARVGACAAELGLEWVVVDTNLHEVDRIWATCAISQRNLAVALALQGMLGVYVMASSHTLEEVRVEVRIDSTYLDPCLIPLLATDRMDLVLASAHMTRAERTEHILDVPGIGRHLNVCCWQPGDGSNCSRCLKCVRTLLTLEALGVVEDFGEVFDLEAYAAVRDRYVVKLYRNGGASFEMGILELAARRGYAFGTWQRLAAAALGPAWLYRLVGRAATAVLGRAASGRRPAP